MQHKLNNPVLVLPSWYPNKIDNFAGDFIQRHVKAIALYVPQYIIHFVKDEHGIITKDVHSEICNYENYTEEIIYYLEKRVSFVKIKNQILREASKSSFVKGLRITCSGRVGGRSKKAQRSKVQIIKYGQTSLHVFSSKIDFASKPAHTAFGLLGIKVWICYN